MVSYEVLRASLLSGLGVANHPVVIISVGELVSAGPWQHLGPRLVSDPVADEI